MLDVLSQSEIDALVNSMNSGEVPTLEEKPEDTVKDYDFRTANRFTKEHIRTIEAVFKNFAHLVSNYFVGTLRTSCEIEVLSMIDEVNSQKCTAVGADAQLSKPDIAKLVACVDELMRG